MSIRNNIHGWTSSLQRKASNTLQSIKNKIPIVSSRQDRPMMNSSQNSASLACTTSSRSPVTSEILIDHNSGTTLPMLTSIPHNAIPSYAGNEQVATHPSQSSDDSSTNISTIYPDRDDSSIKIRDFWNDEEASTPSQQSLQPSAAERVSDPSLNDNSSTKAIAAGDNGTQGPKNLDSDEQQYKGTRTREWVARTGRQIGN